MNQIQDQVMKFLTMCKQCGFSYTIKSESVLGIRKHFTPGDKAAFTDCDMCAFDILGLAPLKGGSVWGTDGGSVGGHVGLTRGYYELNKSGQAKSFMKALAQVR